MAADITQHEVNCFICRGTGSANPDALTLTPERAIRCTKCHGTGKLIEFRMGSGVMTQERQCRCLDCDKVYGVSEMFSHEYDSERGMTIGCCQNCHVALGGEDAHMSEIVSQPTEDRLSLTSISRAMSRLGRESDNNASLPMQASNQRERLKELWDQGIEKVPGLEQAFAEERAAIEQAEKVCDQCDGHGSWFPPGHDGQDGVVCDKCFDNDAFQEKLGEAYDQTILGVDVSGEAIAELGEAAISAGLSTSQLERALRDYGNSLEPVEDLVPDYVKEIGVAAGVAGEAINAGNMVTTDENGGVVRITENNAGDLPTSDDGEMVTVNGEERLLSDIRDLAKRAERNTGETQTSKAFHACLKDIVTNLRKVFPPMADWEFEQTAHHDSGGALYSAETLVGLPYEFMDLEWAKESDRWKVNLHIGYPMEGVKKKVFGCTKENCIAVTEQFVEKIVSRHGFLGGVNSWDRTELAVTQMFRMNIEFDISLNPVNLPNNTEPECRGDFVLGTGCGKCCKCIRVQQTMDFTALLEKNKKAYRDRPTNKTHKPTRKRRGIQL